MNKTGNFQKQNIVFLRPSGRNPPGGPLERLLLSISQAYFQGKASGGDTKALKLMKSINKIWKARAN